MFLYYIYINKISKYIFNIIYKSIIIILFNLIIYYNIKLILLNKLFILIPNISINLFNSDKYLNIIIN